MDGQTIFEKLIYENPEKGFQYKLTISEFRDVQYINIRKYFLSFDEGYVPSKEGATIPISIEIVQNLFDGLVELLSKSEAIEIIKKHINESENRRISE